MSFGHRRGRITAPDYSFEDLDQTFQASLARKVSIHPVSGLDPLGDDEETGTTDILNSIVAAQSLWQQQLQAMALGGFTFGPTTQDYCYYCPPPGIKSNHHPCKRKYICPHCYGRYVAEIFGLTFNSLNSLTNYQMDGCAVVDRATTNVKFCKQGIVKSFKKELHQLKEAWSDSVKRTQPYGGRLIIIPEPENMSNWKLHVCSAFLFGVNQDIVVQTELFSRMRSPEFFEIPELYNSWGDFAIAIALRFQYPKKLLTSDPEVTVRYLQARKNLLLAQSYGSGSFRQLPGDNSSNLNGYADVESSDISVCTDESETQRRPMSTDEVKAKIASDMEIAAVRRAEEEY